ncbi:MAG TPA: peptidoglycan editing factor PgeF [Polyangiaceae bacterium]|nr:peptidoglycan editing factor PgeF [Polyangiaceae bacterium]
MSDIASPRIESPLLSAAGFRHGFFTRLGGVSPAPRDSLDFATSGGADPEHFAANLAVAAAGLGVPSDRIYLPSQVHGTTCLAADGSEAPADFRKREGDAVFSRTPGVASAIRTADCVPVLLACPQSGWTAAIHAGWKGCVRGVVPTAVATLRAAGATRLLAAVGPHIELASFEVGDDVAEELRAASPDPDIVVRGGAKPHVDLRRMVSSQLLAAGLALEDIDHVRGDTFAEPERFFSFRRDAELSGRLLTAIVAR